MLTCDKILCSYPVINFSVAMVRFRTYVAIGSGVNYTRDVSQVLCHIEIRFQRLYQCFYRR